VLPVVLLLVPMVLHNLSQRPRLSGVLRVGLALRLPTLLVELSPRRLTPTYLKCDPQRQRLDRTTVQAAGLSGHRSTHGAVAVDRPQTLVSAATVATVVWVVAVGEVVQVLRVAVAGMAVLGLS
jgi:hypothetical protein